MGAHNSHSYAAMRMSQQAFSSGGAGAIGGPSGLAYASGALNSSMGIPLQQTVNSSIDLNNSAQINSMNNTGGMPRQQVNSKNTTN